MDDPSLSERMAGLLRAKDVAVLATMSAEGPHASLMAYVAAPDGKRLWMASEGDTRKVRNLRAEPRVSLLVDTREMLGKRGRVQALTVFGLCRVLEAGAERDAALAEVARRCPLLRELAASPGAVALEVAVTGMLLLDGVREARFLSVG
jgi:nitroimidazol reductase NimA-like FMN-containing flavoprotein (pyridoxamine 5'-phosphate oxidase superfamily)